MARGKKKESALTPEEKLAQALVPVEEQPYSVPENWCWVRLSELSSMISKGTTPSGGKSAYIPNGIHFLRVENINDDGTISHDNIACVTEEMHTGFLKRSMLEKKDVLVSIAGTLGKTGIVRETDLPLNTNQAVAFIRLKTETINEQYIKGAIDNPVAQELLLSKTKVTSIPNLTLEIIGDCPIPLAPLSEQHRIVTRIESLFAKLDEAKEKAQVVLDSFETRKAAILHKAFSGELTVRWRRDNSVDDITWKKTQIGEESVLITKGASPRWQGISYTDDRTQTLFVTSENVREGFLDFSKEKYLDNRINDIQKRSVLKNGDVLVNIVGASIGRAAIFDLNCLANTNQAVCIIRTSVNMYNKYLCYYLNSPMALEYYGENKVETARANISLTDISRMDIMLPTYSEQTVIVNLLEELLQEENRAQNAVISVIDQIDAMKKSILAKAFRGELGTNDPGEESAVELLKKVLA